MNPAISTILLALGSFEAMLLTIAPLAGSVLLAYGVYNVVVDLRGGPRRRIIDRLRGESGRAKGTDEGLDFEAFRKQTAEATGLLAQMISKVGFTAHFQRTLEQANVPWSAAQTLVNLTTLACVVVAVMLVLNFGVLASFGAAMAAFVLPIMYLWRMRKARLKKLMQQLPDVFELLGQALRAGNSLASGMHLIAKELPDPAGTEFGRVFHEQNLGLKIEDALKNLADRVDVLDVRFFVTAVLIQRQVGGDLAEVLDKISAVIRERIQLHGMVQALTAEGRLSGYVLLALPVVVFIALQFLNPGYINVLLTDAVGRMLLTVAVVQMLMGWALIKKIINIKV